MHVKELGALETLSKLFLLFDLQTYDKTIIYDMLVVKKKYGFHLEISSGAYSGVSWLSEEGGEIISCSAYWLGPYLYKSSSPLSSTTNTASSSSAVVDCLGLQFTMGTPVKN